MALQVSDIFPLCPIQGTTNNARILEPHKCRKEVVYPTHMAESISRTIFRKRVGRPYVEIAYDYENITQYEYDLINSFYRRMKGAYDSFYVVDWSTPYKIKSFPTSSQALLYTVTDLDLTTGFAGNTVLFYNSGIVEAQNKEIKYISNISSYTITLSTPIYAGLRTTSAVVYLLYPCIFKTDKLTPTINDFCVEKQAVTVKGHGTRTLFGPISNITVTFTLLGSINV